MAYVYVTENTLKNIKEEQKKLGNKAVLKVTKLYRRAKIQNINNLFTIHRKKILCPTSAHIQQYVSLPNMILLTYICFRINLRWRYHNIFISPEDLLFYFFEGNEQL